MDAAFVSDCRCQVRLLSSLAGGLFTLGGATASPTLIIDQEVRLNVIYTGGSIEDGPLLLGLTDLLSQVNAMFFLGSATAVELQQLLQARAGCLSLGLNVSSYHFIWRLTNVLFFDT
ncbi:MAG: hypothetical protein AMJ65_13615 [Phycisphaerae bacterium SG8_4]|nr:MAG: hypothetical protein AMJ65_13615 [Phycisphaerae bacterium SG8_4]